MRTLSFLLLFAVLLASCGQNAPATPETAPEAMAMKYTLTPFAPSQEYPDAAITTMTYKNGQFDFGVGGSSYKLGEQTPDAPQKMCANSGQGQHIHLIVDNQPYIAKYEASFRQKVADGEHYLLAFLSRSYHESLKTPTAFTAQKVMVKDSTITTTEAVTQPMLFYSRPKGDYKGKAETDKVMLDFYLVNAALGADYKVKADINGEEHVLDTWQPYYVEGLPMGENTITLTLVDANGQAVNTPLNPVTRKFNLVADPAEATN